MKVIYQLLKIILLNKKTTMKMMMHCNFKSLRVIIFSDDLYDDDTIKD